MPDRNAPRDRWLVFAQRLALFTVAYNLVEGLAAMGLGAADGSIALAGFGADSFVEVGSAVLVLWRLRAPKGCASSHLNRERRATLGIGLLFLALALGTGLASLLQLAGRRHPDTTLPGLAISVLSLSCMVWLWRAKRQAARALDSRALAGDAACSLACVQLSAVLFAGSLGYFLAPRLWWLDAVAALVLAGFMVREGLAGIRAARRPDFDGGCGCH